MQKVFFLITFVFLSLEGGARNVFVRHQMRAVWITTVSNIDWPSAKGLSSEKQKQELIEYLNFFDSLNLNTVFFQVRPSSDAFYQSSYEPWSYYLTGKKNQSPEPFYDPLSFLIKEAHKRGIDVHAWINPFRAETLSRHAKDTSLMSHLDPKWVLKYGTKYYIDPGVSDARKYVLKVVMDIVSRYNVDGVHIDDYFYPYPISGVSFPDNRSYSMSETKWSKKNWRRENINAFIRDINDSIKKEKPHVLFGVSPFAVWRNKTDDQRGSATSALASYDDLYADVYKWIDSRWIDYVVPQLYWKREFKRAPQKILMDWWDNLTYKNGVMFVPGIGIHNYLKTSRSSKFGQHEARLQMTNMAQYNVAGYGFYNASSLKKNPDTINDFIKNQFFLCKALPPLIDTTQIATAHIRIKFLRNSNVLYWKPKNDIYVKYYVVYMREQRASSSHESLVNVKNIFKITNEQYLNFNKMDIDLAQKKFTFVVEAIDRFNRTVAISKFYNISF